MDVAQTHRFSMTSETASAATSLSEKSVSASLNDDGAASTRALAGSIANYKVSCFPYLVLSSRFLCTVVFKFDYVFYKTLNMRTTL